MTMWYIWLFTYVFRLLFWPLAEGTTFYIHYMNIKSYVQLTFHLVLYATCIWLMHLAPTSAQDAWSSLVATCDFPTINWHKHLTSTKMVTPATCWWCFFLVAMLYMPTNTFTDKHNYGCTCWSLYLAIQFAIAIANTNTTSLNITIYNITRMWSILFWGVESRWEREVLVKLMEEIVHGFEQRHDEDGDAGVEWSV